MHRSGYLYDVEWTKVPYYILDLIQQTTVVGVPGLGRFESTLCPAVIDLPRRAVHPPRRDALFRPEDAGDPELLSLFIAYATGIPEAEARSAVLAFSQEVFRQTAGGREFEIFRFGTFFRSHEDEIRFTPQDEAFNLLYHGLLPVEIPEDNMSVSPEVAPEIEQVVEPASPSSSGVEGALGADSGSRRLDEDTPDVSQRMWWGILVSAILLITVLCAYLAWDILSHREMLVSAKIIALPAIVSDSAKADVSGNKLSDTIVIPVTSDLLQPVIDTMVQPSPAQPSGNCFIVVGAFADTANVVRMEVRLREMGYVPVRLPTRSLVRVAIQCTCDPVALGNVLDDARSRIHPQAWIY